MSFKTFLYTIVLIIFLIYTITSGFNFVGIEVTSYINYLIWFICLIVFYFMLPSKVGTFFSDKN